MGAQASHVSDLVDFVTLTCRDRSNPKRSWNPTKSPNEFDVALIPCKTKARCGAKKGGLTPGIGEKFLGWVCLFFGVSVCGLWVDWGGLGFLDLTSSVTLRRNDRSGLSGMLTWLLAVAC